jgi:hypothetical protein
MSAPLNVTLLVVFVKVPPPQVVAGAAADAEVDTLRLAGSVSVRLACVRAKAFELLSVIVSVETTFSPTLAGENASVTVGAEVVTVNGVGQAPALVPAEAATTAALVMAPPAATDSVAVSVSPRLSVTTSVTVPVLPFGVTVTCAAVEPGGIKVLGLADHAYEATVRPQEGALPPASKTAGAPTLLDAGTTTAAIGRCAALTALSAFAIP